MAKLDVKTLDALKPREKAYRVSDGDGLLLDVRPTGAKVWMVRLTVDGRRRDMGLGGYPLVSLKTARQEAEKARRVAAGGSDPIGQRVARIAAEKAARVEATEAADRTFRAMAMACIKAQAPGWKSRRTAALWETSLENHAFPTLGAMPVAEVDRAAVLRAIDAVWTSRPATARKVLRRIGTVLRYAAAHGWRANDNPADARMLRHAGLSALPGGRKQPSLPWAKAPAFMKALDTRPGLAPLALHFGILTAVRSGEVRGALWSELSFDGDTPVWAIAGERMKGKKSADVQHHRVPLVPQALLVLARSYTLVTGATTKIADLPGLARLMGKTLIFPSAKPGRPLSDMALSAVMRRMNEGNGPWRDLDGREAVPHGWRATFRTWVDDTRPGDAEAAEKALAHEDRNAASRAYRRSDLLDLRIPLMIAWGNHCTGPASETALFRSGRKAIPAHAV